jgi:hypothetical protein
MSFSSVAVVAGASMGVSSDDLPSLFGGMEKSALGEASPSGMHYPQAVGYLPRGERRTSRSPARPIAALKLSARCRIEDVARRSLYTGRRAMAPLIEASPPKSWQELETGVAQILGECGYDVEVQKNVTLAGGNVNIDVWADDHSSPPNVIAVECKHWTTPATLNVVHAFGTVVGDSGANTGLIVSSVGFQQGAVEAAAYSNVRLLDWVQFQEMFLERWFRQYMSETLAEETDALHEYTEPIYSGFSARRTRCRRLDANGSRCSVKSTSPLRLATSRSTR